MTLPVGARANHWEPVEWRPHYEQIVLEICAGTSQVEIARKYGLTKVHVCNINRTRQAAEIKARVLAEIQSGSKLTIEARLKAASEKSIERIEAMLDNDELFADKPLAVSDRAFRMLEGMNKLKASGGTNIQNNTNNIVNVPLESIERFSKALESANQVRALHAGGTDNVATVGRVPTGTKEDVKAVRVTDGTLVEVGVR